jgi:cytoskeletal protein RodZ
MSKEDQQLWMSTSPSEKDDNDISSYQSQVRSQIEKDASPISTSRIVYYVVIGLFGLIILQALLTQGNSLTDTIDIAIRVVATIALIMFGIKAAAGVAHI